MRKIRTQKIERRCILLSYDPDKDGLEGHWLDMLLDKGEAPFDTWNAKDTWEGMVAYIYEKNKGIVAGAQIVKPLSDEEDGILGAVDEEKYPFEIQPPISLKKLRELGIITKNPPQTFQYLTKEQCELVESLLE